VVTSAPFRTRVSNCSGTGSSTGSSLSLCAAPRVTVRGARGESGSWGGVSRSERAREGWRGGGVVRRWAWPGADPGGEDDVELGTLGGNDGDVVVDALLREVHDGARAAVERDHRRPLGDLDLARLAVDDVDGRDAAPDHHRRLHAPVDLQRVDLARNLPPPGRSRAASARSTSPQRAAAPDGSRPARVRTCSSERVQPTMHTAVLADVSVTCRARAARQARAPTPPAPGAGTRSQRR
jgi:hypothetical protein